MIYTRLLSYVGAWGRVEHSLLHLDGVVLSDDGRQRIAASSSGPPSSAADLGQQVAENLIAQGAQGLIAAARIPSEPGLTV